MSPIRTSQTPRTTRIYKLYYLSTILYIYMYRYIVIYIYILNKCHQEQRCYWCWKSTTETDKNGSRNEIGVASSGHLDADTAKSLMSLPEHRKLNMLRTWSSRCIKKTVFLDIANLIQYRKLLCILFCFGKGLHLFLFLLLMASCVLGRV